MIVLYLGAEIHKRVFQPVCYQNRPPPLLPKMTHRHLHQDSSASVEWCCGRHRLQALLPWLFFLVWVHLTTYIHILGSLTSYASCDLLNHPNPVRRHDYHPHWTSKGTERVRKFPWVAQLVRRRRKIGIQSRRASPTLPTRGRGKKCVGDVWKACLASLQLNHGVSG